MSSTQQTWEAYRIERISPDTDRVALRPVQVEGEPYYGGDFYVEEPASAGITTGSLYTISCSRQASGE